MILLEIKLFNIYVKDVIRKDSSRFSFTPDEGFRLKFTSQEDAGMYTCEATRRENHLNPEELTFIVHVLGGFILQVLIFKKRQRPQT
jgi:hypothetical protein